MVALLTSDPIYRLPRTERAADSFARRPRQRHLHAVPPAPRAVEPGADAGDSPMRVSMLELSMAAAVVVLAILVVASFRSVQAPPAEGWSPAPAAAVAPPLAGERVIQVMPGDTLWGIAGRLDPSGDRRSAVQQLAERNGSSAIWAGQQLVVPATLANL